MKILLSVISSVVITSAVVLLLLCGSWGYVQVVSLQERISVLEQSNQALSAQIQNQSIVQNRIQTNQKTLGKNQKTLRDAFVTIMGALEKVVTPSPDSEKPSKYVEPNRSNS